MKKILVFILTISISIGLFAQLPVASKVKNLGSCKTGDVVPFNKTLQDTLKSADTLFYKVLVTHSSVCYPYMSQLTKLVAADTTATMTFWQSVDGTTNWQQVLSTTSPSAFSATIAKSTTTGADYDGWRSVIWFRSQYFGVRFIAKTKTSFKTIYYGSLRFDNN